MIRFEQRFDPVTRLQYINNEPSVLHCHHYTTLFIKLALDMEKYNGLGLLREAMEESLFLVFRKSFIRDKIEKISERIAFGEEYYALVGMGQLKVKEYSEKGGVAELTRSHVDEGWVKKFGKPPQPINSMTEGYLAALFAASYNTYIQTYEVIEKQSMALGNSTSLFTITKRS